MDDPKPLVIGPKDGFTPHIGELVAMMNYARLTTLRAVQGLGTEALDFRLDPSANSIGALLTHVAAVEVSYQLGTFEGRRFSADELGVWGAALELGGKAAEAIRGRPLEHYLGILEEVRAKTLAELARRSDDWLYQETPFWGGQTANNYFKWFHVFEDELNHRGQIRMIRKRLPEPA